jgi:hypothetical protein
MMDLDGFRFCHLITLHTFRKLLASVLQGLEGQIIYKHNNRLEDSISAPSILHIDLT